MKQAVVNNIVIFFLNFLLLFSRSYQFVFLLDFVIISFVASQTILQVERFQEILVADTLVFKGKCMSYNTCNDADAFGLSIIDPCQCRCKDSTTVSSSDNKCVSVEKISAKVDQVSPYQLFTKFTVNSLMQDEIYIYLCSETSCSRNISYCTIDFENSFYDSSGWQRIWQKKIDVDFFIVKNSFGIAIQFKTVQCAMNKYSGMLLKLSLQCQVNNQVQSGSAVFSVVGSYKIGVSPKDRTTCSKFVTPIPPITSSTIASITSSKIFLTSTVPFTNNSHLSKNGSFDNLMNTTVKTIKTTTSVLIANNTYVFKELIKSTDSPSLSHVKVRNANTNNALISAAVVLIFVVIGSCIIIIFLYKRWRRAKRNSVIIDSNQQLSFEQITHPHPVFFLNEGSIYRNGGSVISKEACCSEAYGIPNISENLDSSIKLSCFEKVFASLEQTFSRLHKKKSVDNSLDNNFDYRMFIDPISNQNYDGFSVNHFDDLSYNIPEEIVITNNYNHIDQVNTKTVSYNNATNKVRSKFEKHTSQSSSEIEDVLYSVPDEINTIHKNTTPVVLCNTQSGYMKPYPNIIEDDKSGDHFYDFPESSEPVLKTASQYENLASLSMFKKTNSCDKIGNIPINEFDSNRKTDNEQRREESIYSEPEHDDRLKNTSIIEATYAVPEQDDSLQI
ncbi:uncharacterized protein LOC101239543 isoform X1 [Hydra vulgaris]|uniref:uncharacterized protein LOC101239543 isoform X1 n=1 Tax=Hydra vulgaris TaxID=6087 RepID=UPI001F5F41D0|nr:uncharacterized protein LOC101239543 isoform X2 [Hydra vulgaris]